jgi:hypothetical protein
MILLSLIFVFPLTVHCVQSIFRYEYLKNDSYSNIKQLLPTVLMLPIDASFSSKATWNKHVASFQLSEHSQDAYFYHFLKRNYEKFIPYREDSAEVADLFYVPTASSAKDLSSNQKFWVDLDKEIHRIAVNGKIRNFVLDRSFMVATFPGQTRPIQTIHYLMRNVRDLRFFRSDNDMTPNGRDIYVPYSVIRSHYNASSTGKRGKKKYFIMAVCREAAGGGENRRVWRTSLFDQLSRLSLGVQTSSEGRGTIQIAESTSSSPSSTSSSLISKNLSSDEFNRGLLDSDFCFVIPGDTPSTSKLYKAIFSGCIPVIFTSYPSQLPFYHLLDWSTFSIIVLKDYIRSSDKIEQLINYLKDLREDELRLLQYKENLEKVSSLFDYSRTKWPSVYHLSLLELKYSIDEEKKLLTL